MFVWAFLKANWGWIWRLAALLAFCGLVWWVSSTIVGWRADSHELPGVKQALKDEQDCVEGSKCAEKVAAEQERQAKITEGTINGYEKEIADLRSRPIPTRVIRVCRENRVRDAGDPQGTAGADAGGVVSGADEFDTRPLRDLALRAEEINSGYRWLRNRDIALSKAPGAK